MHINVRILTNLHYLLIIRLFFDIIEGDLEMMSENVLYNGLENRPGEQSDVLLEQSTGREKWQRMK